VRSKYSLEAALTLRGARAEARARDVGEKAAQVLGAARELGRAEQALAAAKQEEAQVRTAEYARLEEGVVVAGELARAAEHFRGRELEQERRANEVDGARRALESARKARAEAATALERAVGERRAVERHREDWESEQRAKQENRAEEQALEQWGAERFGWRSR